MESSLNQGVSYDSTTMMDTAAVPSSAAQQMLDDTGKMSETIAARPARALRFDVGLEPPNVLFRQVQLADIALSTSAPVKGAILLRSVATEWAANVTIADELGKYYGFRGDFELSLVTTGAALTYGLYAATMQDDGASNVEMGYTTPVSEQNATGTATVEVRNVPQHMCAWINPAESKTVRFVLPYHSCKPFYFPLAFDPWKLALATYSPIKSATNVTTASATIRVYIRLLPGATMAGAVKQSGTVSKSLVAASDLAAALGYSRTQVASTMPFAPMIRRGAHYLSNMSVDESIERIGLMPTSSLDASAAVGGGDDDQLSLRSLCARPSAISFFSISTANVANDVLADLPVTPFLSADPTDGGGTSAADTLQPCVTGYVGWPFDFWRGTMCYRVIIPASSIHRAAVQLLWTPNAVLNGSNLDTTQVANAVVEITGPTCIDVRIPFAATQYGCRSAMFTRNSLDNTIFNTNQYTNGRLTVRLVAPLVAQSANSVDCVVLAWMEEPQFWGPKTIFNRKYNTGGVANWSSAGKAFQLQSGPAEVPDTAPASIPLPAARVPVDIDTGVALCATGGADGFDRPVISATCYERIVRDLAARDPRDQKQSSDQSDLCEVTKVDLVRKTYDCDAAADMGSDSLLSVRALLQKPAPYAGSVALAGGGERFSFDGNFCVPPWGAVATSLLRGVGTPEALCWPGYYAAMFLGVRGTVVDHLFLAPATSSPAKEVAYVLPVRTCMPARTAVFTQLTVASNSFAAAPQLVIPGNAIEVAHPFRGGAHEYWPSRFVQVIPDDDRAVDVASYTFYTSTGASYMWPWRSWGSDVSVAGFRRTPQIYRFQTG